ncbi:MAG TPA: hypothetical protein VFT67_02805 [Jatrophihabitantaceae bacterium]|nr:hypothetical protein [Jatrophihabitantaceae bacterium]
MNRILELVGLRRGEDSVPIGRTPFAVKLAVAAIAVGVIIIVSKFGF